MRIPEAVENAGVKGGPHGARRTVMELLVVVVLFAVGAAAQEGHPPALTQGSRTLEVWTAGADGLYGTTTGTNFWATGLRVGKVLTREHGRGWYRGSLEYAFDVVPVVVVGGPRRMYGGGLDPFVFKWNFKPRKRLAPYFEFAGGGLFTRGELPRGTSTFNFVTEGGPGVRFLGHGRRATTIAIKYFHMSNATLGTLNPGINGIQVVVGQQWSR